MISCPAGTFFGDLDKPSLLAVTETLNTASTPSFAAVIVVLPVVKPKTLFSFTIATASDWGVKVTPVPGRASPSYKISGVVAVPAGTLTSAGTTNQ